MGVTHTHTLPIQLRKTSDPRGHVNYRRWVPDDVFYEETVEEALRLLEEAAGEILKSVTKPHEPGEYILPFKLP